MNGIFNSTYAAALFAQPFSFGAIEQDIVSNEAIGRLLLACLLGGIIGIEREWKSRSAGVRTNLLICMGCAFFTLLSAVLAGENGTNKGQVASNIVQGIGFLGAGLILHNRNRISGLASAASIFVVASIGMACGAGLYFAAIIATLIVLTALAVIGVLEWKVNLKAYPVIYEARGSNESGMMQSILSVMDLEHQRLEPVDKDPIGQIQRISFSLSATRRRHDSLRHRLLAEPSIDDLKTFRDPEED